MDPAENKNPDPPRDIHTAIIEVMKNVGYVQKQRSGDLKYTFAGERALIAAVRPFMVEFGIYMAVVEYRDIVRGDYTTRNGAVMNSTSVSGVVRFTHAPSGTFIDVASVGEGSDSGDKSANKAATGLYKYAIRQTFMIETGDDPDDFPSDKQSKPDRKPAAGAETTPPPTQAENSAGGQPTTPPPASAADEKKPAGNGKKPAADPNGKPTPEMIARFNEIITAARAAGITVNVDPEKMTVAALTTAADSIKKQTAARTSAKK